MKATLLATHKSKNMRMAIWHTLILLMGVHVFLLLGCSRSNMAMATEVASRSSTMGEGIIVLSSYKLKVVSRREARNRGPGPPPPLMHFPFRQRPIWLPPPPLMNIPFHHLVPPAMPLPPPRSLPPPPPLLPPLLVPTPPPPPSTPSLPTN